MSRPFVRLVPVLALLLAAPAHAATIASWANFGQPGDQVATPGSGSPNVTASSLARGPDLGATAGANSLNSNGWSGSDAGDYFELGFTVDLGWAVELDELYIGTRSSNTGPGTLGVYTNLDGFASPVAQISQPGADFANSVIDLSGLGPITGAFSVRLIEIGDTQADGSGATAAGGTFRVGDYFDGTSFSDTRFEGTLVSLPEPSAAALLAGALACMAALARRFEA